MADRDDASFTSLSKYMYIQIFEEKEWQFQLNRSSDSQKSKKRVTYHMVHTAITNCIILGIWAHRLALTSAQKCVLKVTGAYLTTHESQGNATFSSQVLMQTEYHYVPSNSWVEHNVNIKAKVNNR
mgnify:CR=1 FL=1